VATPVLAVLAQLLAPRRALWVHLWETQLVELLGNTLLLLLGVGIGAGLLGTLLGWLVAMHDFPGRSSFEWLLLLPLAMPAYVTGYAFLGLLDFAGPVQTGVRSLLGPDLRLPPVPAGLTVPAVMALVLYPYVYLMARTAFLAQRAGTLEAARGLGRTAPQAFRSVALPLARPALAAGIALALMEALADFGTVSLFGYRTLTEGVYRVWFGMFDRTAAAQLAAVLMLVAAALLLAERRTRGRARFAEVGGRPAAAAPRPLPPARGWTAAAACAAVVGVAFAVPLGVLLAWSLEALRGGQTAGGHLALAWNTASLALAAALLTTLAGTVLGYGVRRAPSRLLRTAVRVAGLGYAIPGAVAAVGILLVLARLDQTGAGLTRWVIGREPEWLLTGSVAALLFAYAVRFLALPLQSIEAGLCRVTPALDEAARGLGAGPRRILARVHLPLLRGSLLAGALLVFVDVMKEMPATMLLRPFGRDTLAVEVWQRTAESQWQEAAIPALCIVAAGLLPVMLLTRLIRGGAPRAPRPGARGRPEPMRARRREPGTTYREVSASMPALIRLDRVQKRYAPHLPPAVEGLSLEVRRGEILVLLGPSGCGKTTALRLIMGFERPDGGRIEVDGRLVADRHRAAPPEQRGMGFVFQDYALFPHMTVAGNIAFGLHRLAAGERRRRTREALELGGLAGLEDRYPHELSGGQQQRVALARAMAPGFEIVLLDEPLSSLDADLRGQLRADLRRVLKETGRTAVLVTHDQEEAFQIADRIGILHRGRLEQVGAPEEVYRRPATRFVAHFVGTAEFVRGTVQAGGIATPLGLLADPSGFPPGTAVDVLIRPEDLAVSPDPQGAATVTGRRFLGADKIHELSLGSCRLSSNQHCIPPLPLGTPVRIRVLPAPVVAFPAEDGGAAAREPVAPAAAPLAGQEITG
jgi:iron(III) transport system permease protein